MFFCYACGSDIVVNVCIVTVSGFLRVVMRPEGGAPAREQREDELLLDVEARTDVCFLAISVWTCGVVMASPCLF